MTLPGRTSPETRIALMTARMASRLVERVEYVVDSRDWGSQRYAKIWDACKSRWHCMTKKCQRFEFGLEGSCDGASCLPTDKAPA